MTDLEILRDLVYLTPSGAIGLVSADMFEATFSSEYLALVFIREAGLAAASRLDFQIRKISESMWGVFVYFEVDV